MTSLLQTFKDFALDILDDVCEIPVPNRSTIGPLELTVGDMANPTAARGNCWVTSNELYEIVAWESYATVDEVDIVGVEAKGLTHYAVYLADQDEKIVLDFTARQFSPDAPFPMIMPVATWHAYMKHVTGRNDLELVVGD